MPLHASTNSLSDPIVLESNNIHNNGEFYESSTLSASQKVEQGASRTHKIVFGIVESSSFNYFILGIIIINALILGLETNINTMKSYSWYFVLLENVFLGIYLFELMVKVYSLRMEYFKSSWNNLDLIIILSSLIAWIVKENVELTVGVSKLCSIIRVFRTVRIVRFLKEAKDVAYLNSLQLIIETIFSSFSTIGTIGVLAGVFLYVCAVASVILYGDINPGKFGSVGKSTVSLFQVITLDRWAEIYTHNTDYKSIWILGFVIIIVETFVFQNLFVAVIVNNLKGSRELIELRGKKRLSKTLKVKGDHNASKVSLGKDKLGTEGLGKLFDQQHGIDDYYPPYLSNRLKELSSSYYMNLASIDHAQESFQRQQKVLDDLLDLGINYQNKEFD